jgi:hypothetical protein
MKTLLSQVLTLALGFSTFLSSQALPRQPVMSLDILQLLASGEKVVSGPTLSFLSDKTLAIGGCGQGRQHCKLMILDLSDRTIHPVAETTNYVFGGSLFRSYDGGVISDRNVGAFRTASLYSPDLRQVQPLSITTLSPHLISTSGKTFGQQFGRNRWGIYRTSASPERIRDGAGVLLSVSDEVVVYQEQSTVRIDGTNGSHLASFLVKSPPKCVTSAQLIGENRIWVESCDGEAIRDFKGKTVMATRKTEGWGFRLGQSSDGGRMLLDRYTRQISVTKRIKEDAVAMGSLGMGVTSEESNGELVRVIDTMSGSFCFEWRQSGGIGEEGFYHADITPSGRSVAIVTRTELAIYDLPLECKAN